MPRRKSRIEIVALTATKGNRSSPVVETPLTTPILIARRLRPVGVRAMLRRKYLFPHVIEMNYQAGRRLGVNVYLIDGGNEFLLIDIGFLDSVDEIVELIRQMDFNLSTCKMIIATHADADHVQGVAHARDLLKTRVAAHPASVGPLETGDEILTYATIKAQGIEIPMPPCKIDLLLDEGDTVEVGSLRLQVWHSPGHTPGHLSFK